MQRLASAITCHAVAICRAVDANRLHLLAAATAAGAQACRVFPFYLCLSFLIGGDYNPLMVFFWWELFLAFAWSPGILSDRHSADQIEAQTPFQATINNWKPVV